MKTAVITGASSGIGQFTSEQLIEIGWKVYGISRTQPSIKDANFVWIKCDLANSDIITTSVKEVFEPSINLLVSNAGVAFEEPASAATRDSYERMFSVNVLAPMLLVNALKNKITNSTIISISSVSDRLVEKDFALYCSSKAANTRYFEALAHELRNATVLTLLPDYVDTPMLRELQAGRDFDWDIAISPQDVASLTVDLACGKVRPKTGSNIIIVTNGLKEDLESREKLYGFNTDTKELIKL
jgi:NAD(P)-dependent dehydrogenase (short-subunit alcohol dehydrogenase family)